MRKYEPLWNLIKKNSTATVEAPIDLHATIVQAVKKEKSMDKGYRLLALEVGKKPLLRHTINGTKITFYLQGILRPNVSNL